MRLYQDIIIALIILGLGLWNGCKDSQYKYFPKTKEELKNLVEDKSINLGEIDTSSITDMSYLFEKTTRIGVDFNGLESWDTSKVKTMRGMFYEADNFNHPIGSWDVSNVEDMGSMFEESWFNQPLDSWDTSKVKNMKKMFSAARSFNQNINAWNVSNVENMSDMFGGAISFNQPLNQWNVANVKDMSSMFNSAESFNQPLDSWDTSKVENMKDMFAWAMNFNQNLQSWNVSKVKNMQGMFYYAMSFNQPLNQWNVANVKDMSSMFYEARDFNQPLDKWDTSKVKNMEKMFSTATSFNQNINAWNVSNVENMSGMFYRASSFRQPLDQWDISKVKDMSAMFLDSTPLNIDSWEIDKAKVGTRDMFLMYQGYEESIPNPFVPKWYDETLINEQDITEAVSSCFKWGIGCEVDKISFKVPFDAKTSTITFFKGKEQGYFENLCLPHPEENNTKRTKKIYNELRQCLSHHKVAQETLMTTHFKDIYILPRIQVNAMGISSIMREMS